MEGGARGRDVERDEGDEVVPIVESRRPWGPVEGVSRGLMNSGLHVTKNNVAAAGDGLRQYWGQGGD